MTATPEISIIIPVLHEGERIRQTLADLAQQLDPVSYEVIVVDGDALGSTISLLPADPRLRSLVAPKGRARQMQAGAHQAQGKILLFLHADTQLPPQALQQIGVLLQDQRYVGGAFDLEIDSCRWILQVVARIASWRSRLTRIPYGDQGIFLRRETFWQVGGYAAIPLMEDVALMRALKRRGERIYIFRDRIRVSARRWETEGILYCTLRNWTLLILYFLGVSPHHLAAWYRPVITRQKSR